MFRNIGDITWISHRKVGQASDWNEIWTRESVQRPGGNLRGLSHLGHGYNRCQFVEGYNSFGYVRC